MSSYTIFQHIIKFYQYLKFNKLYQILSCIIRNFRAVFCCKSDSLNGTSKKNESYALYKQCGPLYDDKLFFRYNNMLDTILQIFRKPFWMQLKLMLRCCISFNLCLGTLIYTALLISIQLRFWSIYCIKRDSLLGLNYNSYVHYQ